MYTKQCSRCRAVSDSTNFPKSSRAVDGIGPRCKPCCRIVTAAYQNTPAGRAHRAWKWIGMRLASQKEYSHIELRMTQEEFLAWAIPEYTAWSESAPLCRSSIDRIDPDGHYELSNIRLLDKGENAKRSRANKNWCAPDGQHWCTGCKQYLLFEAFGKSKNRPHGLAMHCKACRVLQWKVSVATWTHPPVAV